MRIQTGQPMPFGVLYENRTTGLRRFFSCHAELGQARAIAEIQAAGISGSDWKIYVVKSTRSDQSLDFHENANPSGYTILEGPLLGQKR